ncbi:RHS repeat domain-containing protein, partial [Parachitinimonas caeni]
IADAVHYAYTAFGELADTSYTYQDEAGRRQNAVSHKTYDQRGLLIATSQYKQGGTAAESLETGKTQYDAFGRAVTQTDGRGIVRHTGYDRLGRVVMTEDGFQRQTRTEFDAFDRVKSVTDPLGHVTVYTYRRDDTLLAGQTIKPGKEGEAIYV